MGPPIRGGAQRLPPPLMLRLRVGLDAAQARVDLVAIEVEVRTVDADGVETAASDRAVPVQLVDIEVVVADEVGALRPPCTPRTNPHYFHHSWIVMTSNITISFSPSKLCRPRWLRQKTH